MPNVDSSCNCLLSDINKISNEHSVVSLILKHKVCWEIISIKEKRFFSNWVFRAFKQIRPFICLFYFTSTWFTIPSITRPHSYLKVEYRSHQLISLLYQALPLTNSSSYSPISILTLIPIPTHLSNQPTPHPSSQQQRQSCAVLSMDKSVPALQRSR